VVKGFASLNDFKPRAMYKAKPDLYLRRLRLFCVGANRTRYLLRGHAAGQLTIYNLNPLFTGGITGLGQTIAVIETVTPTTARETGRVIVMLSDCVTAYPSGSYTQVHPGGCDESRHERRRRRAAIDVELATAFAPNAAIENISCPSRTVTFGGLIALPKSDATAAGLPTAIVSVSYGEWRSH